MDIIQKEIDKTLQLDYEYSMCNMHINELLDGSLTFTKLNPKIVNFNDLKSDITKYLLEKTYKHYYE